MTNAPGNLGAGGLPYPITCGLLLPQYGRVVPQINRESKSQVDHQVEAILRGSDVGVTKLNTLVRGLLKQRKVAIRRTGDAQDGEVIASKSEGVVQVKTGGPIHVRDKENEEPG